MPTFSIHVQGAQRVSTKFNRMGADAANALPAFEAIRTLIYRIEEATFSGQGRRGGGSWRRDTDEWLQRKLRLGLDPRINHATLALLNSMTKRDDEHQRLNIGPTTLRITSTLPYAARTQRERPFVKFTERDRFEMVDIMRSHLMKAWRERKI